MTEFYAVRNKEGKYFRAKGYGGYGDSWRDTLKEAKIYTNPRGARTVITWWAKNYPEYGTPELVKFTVFDENITVVDETKRVDKAIQKMKEKEEKETQRKYLRKALEWWGDKPNSSKKQIVKEYSEKTGDKSVFEHSFDQYTFGKVLDIYLFFHPERVS